LLSVTNQTYGAINLDDFEFSDKEWEEAEAIGQARHNRWMTYKKEHPYPLFLEYADNQPDNVNGVTILSKENKVVGFGYLMDTKDHGKFCIDCSTEYFVVYPSGKMIGSISVERDEGESMIEMLMRRNRIASDLIARNFGPTARTFPSIRLHPNYKGDEWVPHPTLSWEDVVESVESGYR
jgi:hypothetical protein